MNRDFEEKKNIMDQLKSGTAVVATYPAEIELGFSKITNTNDQLG
mgnify:CR=1 FL=1